MEQVSFNNRTILVAEDNDDTYAYIWHSLIKTGITVIRALNGLEAVSLCHDHPEFSLILMDGMMPGLTGYEATVEIKKFRPELPIIILTAYVDQTSIREAVRSGCNDYLAKPIGPEELYAAIQKWLVQ